MLKMYAPVTVPAAAAVFLPQERALLEMENAASQAMVPVDDDDATTLSMGGAGSSQDHFFSSQDATSLQWQVDIEMAQIRESCERYQVCAQAWMTKIASHKYTDLFLGLIENFVLDITMFLSQDPQSLQLADVHEWHNRMADSYTTLKEDAQRFVTQGLLDDSDVLAAPAKKRRLRTKTAA